MVWKDEIEVSLVISKGLRVGSGRAGLEVDLPLVREHAPKTNNSSNSGGETFFTSNLASSFRGILRKSVQRMIGSTGLRSIEDSERSLFGSRVTDQDGMPVEGKIQVKLADQFEPVKSYVRTGVRIDEVFGSVAPGALFTYEVLEGESSKLSLKFRITCTFPLTEQEAALLLAGLNGLLYDSIGGFNSRGLGLIERVDVNSSFKDFALPHLRNLLKQDGG